MINSEFSLISYLKKHMFHRADCILGIGDDCAILEVPSGKQLVSSMDTLVSGCHFPLKISGSALAYRSLAVNLSDLAAMGAVPAWVSIGLTLPNLNEAWLKDYCDTLISVCKYYQLQLIGGDFTQGPMTTTLQIFGFVDPGCALRRDGAKAGDHLFVSHYLGDAGAALAFLDMPQDSCDASQRYFLERYYRPTARLALGQALVGVASSMIDISDGLLGDLRHILKASQVGAQIELERLPLSQAMQQAFNRQEALDFALSAGDAYELCFTVPPACLGALEEIKAHMDLTIVDIGVITAMPGLVVLDKQGLPYTCHKKAFEHFS